MGGRWPSRRTVVAVSGGWSWRIEPILEPCRLSQAPISAYVRWTSSGELAGLGSSLVPQKSRMYFIRSTSYYADKRAGPESTGREVSISAPARLSSGTEVQMNVHSTVLVERRDGGILL